MYHISTRLGVKLEAEPWKGSHCSKLFDSVFESDGLVSGGLESDWTDSSEEGSSSLSQGIASGLSLASEEELGKVSN